MKIALLSGASSIHTIRWANALDEDGHEVHVISQHSPIEPFNERVRLHLLNNRNRGVLGYYLNVKRVKEILKSIQPDVLNAHYASGYGTTARLVGFHPLVLSVWGSDVYDFPLKSFFHKSLVKKNLLAADVVASTSYCMAEQTRLIAPNVSNIHITPFGVDVDKFVSEVSSRPAQGETEVIIGTVKALEEKYGVDLLIKAFAVVRARVKHRIKVTLRVVGTGSQLHPLVKLSHMLGLGDAVQFIGRVPHPQVPVELAKLDIYAALSRLDSESFGVAIIEAGAASKPVIVSDVGGLPEVVINNETGFVVQRENVDSAADALEKLVMDADLRVQMGKAGRKHVCLNYDWKDSVKTMVQLYEKTIQLTSKAR